MVFKARRSALKEDIGLIDEQIKYTEVMMFDTVFRKHLSHHFIGLPEDDLFGQQAEKGLPGPSEKCIRRGNSQAGRGQVLRGLREREYTHTCNRDTHFIGDKGYAGECAVGHNQFKREFLVNLQHVGVIFGSAEDKYIDDIEIHFWDHPFDPVSFREKRIHCFRVHIDRFFKRVMRDTQAADFAGIDV